MKQHLAGTVVLVSLVTTACAGPGAASRAPSTEEAPASAAKAALSPAEARETLRAADAALAEAMARKGSAEGLASAAAEDALLLLDGHYTLRGPEAIRARLTAEPLERDGVLSAEALVWDVSADGRMGYTVGHVLLDSTASAPGGAGATGASSATGAPTASGAAPSGATGSSAATAAPGTAGATSSGATGPSAAPGAPRRLKPGKRYQRYLAAWTRTPDGPWRLAAAVYGRAPGPLQVPPAFSVAPPTAQAPATALAAPSDVLAEAFAADSAFSDQSGREGMGIAFGAWAAPDAVIPSGPGGFFGHDAIKSGYAPFTREKVDLRWEPRLGAAASSGDMAYTVGRAVSVSPGPDGKPATSYVKYLSVWRRQPDGEWRYVADSGNGNPGPDGP
jgi:ketosteroid isomerase-like protein